MATTFKGITYGTFDCLHYGHLNLLRRIKERVDYLIVGLSTDEFNTLKGKKAYHSYEERKRNLEALRYVDEVIPETCWEQKDEQTKGKLFFMGDDWEGKFENCIYLPRTKEISSTKIRQII